jgi:Zn-dependent peptidase ImmA (M78 family)
VTSALERGFKAEAERLAIKLRRELGLSAFDRFDPRALAAHLGYRVVTLSDLIPEGAAAESVAYFTTTAPELVSAITIADGEARLIVENHRHSSSRRSSSLTHELAHIVLGHQPGPALGVGGCRCWNKKDEEEADCLASTLLVPRPAAVHFARHRTLTQVAANNMGVSVAMMEWRMNSTGALAQAKREQFIRAKKAKPGS